MNNIKTILITGGAETVFNITRNNKLVEHNYSGFIKHHKSNELSNVPFKIYKEYNKLFRIINYLFSIRNFIALYIFVRRNEIEIIHIHNYLGALSSSILLAIFILKRLENIKVVQTLHDFHIACPNSVLYNFVNEKICEKCIGAKFKFYPFFISCDRRGKVYSILKAVRSFLSNNIFNQKKLVDIFIAPSNTMINILIKEGVKNEKIKLVRNPVVYGNNNDNNSIKKNIVCYYGRLSKEKNIRFIVDSFSEWKNRTNNDFVLYIIGEGEEEELIRKHVNDSIYKNHIYIFEFMEHDVLKNLLQPVKYFIMASKLYENAPMTILESITLNIIPIVPNLGGMRETIVDVIKIGRVYENGNTESFINCLENLEMNYDVELNNLLIRKNIIKSDYSVENYYKTLFNIYSKLKIN